ncbi:transposase [Xanthomonas theicola]|uniref:transposase n=1 Tax=Xanthomonas theicola TaxID=56464 RepID=UPI003CCD7E2A
MRRQRLAPSQRFVKRIGRHWDGIAAYCHPDHKIGRGRVEGLNNKIRVIPRSAYGDRDQDDLRLKIIASVLPPLPENARLTHTDPRRPQFRDAGDGRGSRAHQPPYRWRIFVSVNLLLSGR